MEQRDRIQDYAVMGTVLCHFHMLGITLTEDVAYDLSTFGQISYYHLYFNISNSPSKDLISSSVEIG